MSLLLAAVLALAPQEDDSRRAREAALGLPGLEQKAPAPDAGPPASFMTPRVKRGPEDYKELLDHNVFSPPRKKEAPKTDKPSDKPPEGPKTRTWVLTGIVFNAMEKRYEALIEDPASKEGKYFKVGDTVSGATISEVTFDQVTVLRGEAPTVLKLKDTLTETISGGGSGSAPAKVEDQGEIEKIRERMKKRNRRESVPDEAEEDAGGKKKPK